MYVAKIDNNIVHIPTPISTGRIAIPGQSRIVTTQNASWISSFFQRIIDGLKKIFCCCQKKSNIGALPIIPRPIETAQPMPPQNSVIPVPEAPIPQLLPVQVPDEPLRELEAEPIPPQNPAIPLPVAPIPQFPPIQVPAEPLRELQLPHVNAIQEELMALELDDRIPVGINRLFYLRDLNTRINVGLHQQVQRLQEAINAHPVNPVQAGHLELKQRGLLHGQAIGDGLGILTVHEDAARAGAMINGRPIEYALFNDPAFLDGGFAQTTRNLYTRLRHAGWSNATDQMICMLRACHRKSQGDARPSSIIFAEELYNLNYGGPERRGGLFGRENPERRGLGIWDQILFLDPQFLNNPQRIALEQWQDDPNPAATRYANNKAVMRTAGLASIYYDNIQELINQTINFAEVTHADPRSLASCIAVNIAIALMINGVTNTDTILHYAREISSAVLCKQMFALYGNVNQNAELVPYGNNRGLSLADFRQHFNQFKTELNRHIIADNFGQLDLRFDQDTFCNTYKCMGAGFVALRLAQNNINQGMPVEHAVRRSLEELIAQGGHADSNSAVAGAMLGAAYGYQSLPESWRANINAQDRVILEQTEQQIADIRRAQ